MSRKAKALEQLADQRRRERRKPSMWCKDCGDSLPSLGHACARCVSATDGVQRGSWRFRAAVIIAKVFAETLGQEEPVIRRALRDAYPWGTRNCYPYNVWCDEVKRQRNGFKPVRNAPRETLARHALREDASLDLELEPP